MVSDGRPWTTATYTKHDQGETQDTALSELLPHLASGCQVRDSLFDEVLGGLQNDAHVGAKLQALAVLRKSIQAHNGDGDDLGGKILTEEDTQKLTTRNMLELYVVRPLGAGAFNADNAIKCECAKILNEITTHMPSKSYSRLFTGDALRSVILLMEYACGSRNNSRLEDEMWNAAVSILKNLLTVVQMPYDVVDQALTCVCGKSDAASTEFCHVLVAKVLLPKLVENVTTGVRLHMQTSLSSMCRRAVKYFADVIANSVDYQVLSRTCATLVCLGEHRFGVDMLLEANCLPGVLKIALSVVTKHEEFLSTLMDKDVYDGSAISQMRDSVTPQMHQLTFDALSVISKIAFTANRRQAAALLDMGVAEAIVKMLNCPISSVMLRTRAANTLGNLGCESETEVQTIIEADALPTLVRTYREVLEQDTKVEAAYAICACASRANRKQVGYIVSCTSRSCAIGSNSCMALMCDVIDFVCKSDPRSEGNIRLCRVVLSALENILNVGDTEAKSHRLLDNPYGRLFLDNQGDEKLAKIAAFPDFQIAKRAMMLSQSFFNTPRLWNTADCDVMYTKTLI
ncbi:Importin subunit related protein, putative [Babesia ovata]|uniref:Importin subunit related protein, putative n=1 Tax=Babesia ovata TaxID=189622 RepID=A0A2H6KEW8_9APIC|nr:Importin subunit related protein, putative [Babesia ovata]GBE61543.1 Importin subunit related protein, putative [Babesia ovata]